MQWIAIPALMMLPFTCFGTISSDETASTVTLKIHHLREQLHQAKMEQMRKEVLGQDYMIADWTAYEQELIEIRKNQQVIKDLQEEIDQLERRKHELSKTKNE